MIRPKGLPDCDCGPWTKIKMELAALRARLDRKVDKEWPADEGKFLKIVNGEVSAAEVDIPDIEVDDHLSLASENPVQNKVLTGVISNKVNIGDLAPVAITGNYDDLTDKPTIPAAQIQSDWDQSDSTALDYIKNKPTIPSSNDYGVALDTSWFMGVSAATRNIKLLNENNGELSKVEVMSLAYQTGASEVRGMTQKAITDALGAKANITTAAGAPTTATVGEVGDFYYDTTNGDLYQCSAEDTVTPSYTWAIVGGSSGGEYHVIEVNISGTYAIDGIAATASDIASLLSSHYVNGVTSSNGYFDCPILLTGYYNGSRRGVFLTMAIEYSATYHAAFGLQYYNNSLSNAVLTWTGTSIMLQWNDVDPRPPIPLIGTIPAGTFNANDVIFVGSIAGGFVEIMMSKNLKDMIDNGDISITSTTSGWKLTAVNSVTLNDETLLWRYDPIHTGSAYKHVGIITMYI